MKALENRTQGAGAPGPTPTPERILDAAEALFADRGFAGAAMRDIAAAVELTPASLYNHFPSKQALYEAVLERGLRPMFGVLDSLAPSDWAPERLDAATDTLMAHMARQPQLPRLLAQEALSGGEHSTRLTQDWLRPLYDQALETFRQSRARGRSNALSIWDDEDLPLLLMLFHHVVLANFALIPMLREVLDGDPLSQASIDRQRRFVRKVVRLLIVGNLTSDEPSGPSPGNGS
jgi:AcrR family transcriptional regulator